MDQFTLGTPGIERVYQPSFVAGDLVGEPISLNMPIGELVGAGRIPGVSNGGAVNLGGENWGVDHVAGIGRRNEDGKQELIILGSDKSDVRVEDDDSNIGLARQEGLLVFSNLEEEKIVIAALIAQCNGWTVDKFNRLGLRTQKVGSLVIGVLGLASKLPREFRIKATNGSETVTTPILER